jgi:antitoxin CcdA
MRTIHAHFRIQGGNPVRNAPDATKRPVNLLINTRTLELAKELGMNLSQTVDSFLGAEVQRRYWERWNDDNKDAIDAYNARIAQEGLPLARYRSF